jgi:hypothetical protein
VPARLSSPRDPSARRVRAPSRLGPAGAAPGKIRLWGADQRLWPSLLPVEYAADPGFCSRTRVGRRRKPSADSSAPSHCDPRSQHGWLRVEVALDPALPGLGPRWSCFWWRSSYVLNETSNPSRSSRTGRKSSLERVRGKRVPRRLTSSSALRELCERTIPRTRAPVAPVASRRSDGCPTG